MYGHGHTEICSGPLGPIRKKHPNSSTHSECNLWVCPWTLEQKWISAPRTQSETQTHVWGEGNFKNIVARVQDTYQHLQNSVFTNFCSIFLGAETGKSGSHLDAFFWECRLQFTEKLHLAPPASRKVLKSPGKLLLPHFLALFRHPE